jgi:diguanylate cyclase (GGDEF)-like protein
VEKDIHVGDLIVEAHVTVLPEGGSVLILHDVTARVDELKERELAEKKIRMIAMQDTLTGLPNRLAFNDHLDSCLEKAAISNTGVAILSFDFNRFKEVNDLMGHAAGDHLLKTAATRLTDLLSKREYAARLGGDEFIVIQEGSSVAEALALATRVVENMAKPLEWAARIIEPNISVGIALFPDQGRNRQDLLSNADIAMYRSKANDDGPVCIFDPSMDQMARNRRNVARDLKLAIPNNELLLHYQPQFKAGTGELAGFEALLRWKSAGRIIVPPSDFIPIAEESGMICEIDEWVLRESCRAMVNWNLVPRIAVNISAKAICQPGLIASIRSTLLETGLAPSRLELEVTETALVQDLNRALHNLRQIKALGISVAMDDFGIGYSSLSLLNSFPFDRIKIDKSFIQLVGSNPRADAIFHTIIGLGSALGVPVLVEGVENSEHLDFATISGCEEVQGFHFGRPVSAPEMNDIFKNLAGPLKYYVIKRQQEATARGALRA